MYKHFISLVSALVCCLLAYSQPSQRIITLRVTPQSKSVARSVDDVADVYHYDCGKSVRFNVAAFSSGIPVEID